MSDCPSYSHGNEKLTLIQFYDRVRVLSVTRSISFSRAMVLVSMSYGFKSVGDFLSEFKY